MTLLTVVSLMKEENERREKVCYSSIRLEECPSLDESIFCLRTTLIAINQAPRLVWKLGIALHFEPNQCLWAQ